MPLCERLRLDAGRSFAHTLTVRIYVAAILLILVMVVTNKHSIDYENIDILFGSNNVKPSNIISDIDSKIMLQSSNIIFNPTTKILIASNDTYGR